MEIDGQEPDVGGTFHPFQFPNISDISLSSTRGESRFQVYLREKIEVDANFPNELGTIKLKIEIATQWLGKVFKY